MESHRERFLSVLQSAGIEFALRQSEGSCLFRDVFIGMLHEERSGEASLYFMRDLSSEDLLRLANAADGEVLIILPESFEEVLGTSRRMTLIDRLDGVRLSRAQVVEHAICVIDSYNSGRVVLIEHECTGFQSIPRSRAAQTIYGST